MKRNMRPKAFTLTELMVVMGVVALLLVILVPTGGKIYALARSSICQNNLNQICAALAVDRSERLAKGGSDGWNFQPANTWPGVPFTVVSDPKMYECPEDSNETNAWSGFGNILSLLQYRNKTPAYSRNLEIQADDPAHQGEGGWNLGTRKGSDQYGEYIEIKTDDNEKVYFNSDTHDGLVRIYLNKGGEVVAKLINHTCGEYNAMLYCGKPLFTNASDPAGVKDPASPMFGWMGPTSSGKIGMEVELRPAYKCSYGMAVGSEYFKFPSHKVLVIDYLEGQVDPLNADTPGKIVNSARHLKRLNVLYADGSVSAASPSQLDPTLTRNADLWRP